MFAISPNPRPTSRLGKSYRSADLSRAANQLRQLGGENRPDAVRLSPNPHGLSNVYPCKDGFYRFAQFRVLEPRPRALSPFGELFYCPLTDPL